MNRLAPLALLAGCSQILGVGGFHETQNDAGSGLPSDSGGTGGSGGTTDSTAMDASDSGTDASDGSMFDGGSNGCAVGAALIYVVDESNRFVQFDANAKTFTTVGTLSCPAGSGAAPFSMAIDRKAQAYILYSDNHLYKIDTTQPGLPCEVTSWSSMDGLEEFGMGYSANAAGSSQDTLFVAGGTDVESTEGGSSTLATIDLSTSTAETIGKLSGWPELTGNANAELWGFFPSFATGSANKTFIAQIDKTNGTLLTQYAEGALGSGTPDAWAFAFYGGDYWVFLSTANEVSGSASPTSVYQIAGSGSISGSAGSVVSTTLATLGSDGGSLLIVGAGVSTCAPLTE